MKEVECIAWFMNENIIDLDTFVFPRLRQWLDSENKNSWSDALLATFSDSQKLLIYSLNQLN